MAANEHPLEIIENLEIDRDQLAVCSSCGFTGKLIDVVTHSTTCQVTTSSPSTSSNNNNNNSNAKPNENSKKSVKADAKTATPSGVALAGTLSKKDRADGCWRDESITLLIELFEQNHQLFSLPGQTKKKAWEKIGGMMSERGHVVSGIQADNKWKFLKKQYKRLKATQNPLTQQLWPFYKAMDQLASKISLDLVACEICEERGGSTGTSASPSGPKTTSSEQAKKKRKLSNAEPVWVKTLRLDMNHRELMAQKRHEEFIQVQKENQLMFKEMMEKFISAIKK